LILTIYDYCERNHPVHAGPIRYIHYQLYLHGYRRKLTPLYTFFYEKISTVVVIPQIYQLYIPVHKNKVTNISRALYLVDDCTVVPTILQ